MVALDAGEVINIDVEVGWVWKALECEYQYGLPVVSYVPSNIGKKLSCGGIKVRLSTNDFYTVRVEFGPLQISPGPKSG